MSSKAMSTLGTEELGTRRTRGHINSYFNQKKHLEYIIKQHKSVSGWTGPKLDSPQLRKKTTNKQQKKITHTHKIEMLPIKVD